MFKRTQQKTVLDEVIDDALQSLRGLDIEDEKYTPTVENVNKLMTLRQNDKPEQVSKDALYAVGGNLLGILLILQHERMHVVASKALALLPKFR